MNSNLSLTLFFFFFVDFIHLKKIKINIVHIFNNNFIFILIFFFLTIITFQIFEVILKYNNIIDSTSSGLSILDHSRCRWLLLHQKYKKRQL